MFFFTIWGGAEVRPKDPDNIVVTVWGGTDILLPTLAEKIVRLKKARDEYGEITDVVIRRTNVITVMGGTVYKAPTVAQEIEKMKQLKDSGSISDQELFYLWQEVIRREDMDVFESLTIMGVAENEHPNRKQEMKDLDRITSRGIISPKERDELQAMIDRTDSSGGEKMQEKLLELLQPSGARSTAIGSAKPANVNSALLE